MFLRMLVRAAVLRRGRATSALLAMIVAAAVATAMMNLYVDVQAKLRKEFRSYGANVVVVGKDGASLPPDALQKIETTLGSRGIAVPETLRSLRLSVTPGAEVAYLDGTAYLYMAMAQEKQGRVEDARESMSKSRVLADQMFPKVDRGHLLGADWADWLRYQIARREADELVKAPAAVSQE
jgi:hypothetical protein